MEFPPPTPHLGAYTKAKCRRGGSSRVSADEFTGLRFGASHSHHRIGNGVFLRLPVPDESTVLRFRHLLEAHGLGEKLFQQVHAYLERQGHDYQRPTLDQEQGQEP